MPPPRVVAQASPVAASTTRPVMWGSSSDCSNTAASTPSFHSSRSALPRSTKDPSRPSACGASGSPVATTRVIALREPSPRVTSSICSRASRGRAVRVGASGPRASSTASSPPITTVPRPSTATARSGGSVGQAVLGVTVAVPSGRRPCASSSARHTRPSEPPGTRRSPTIHTSDS